MNEFLCRREAFEFSFRQGGEGASYFSYKAVYFAPCFLLTFERTITDT